MAKRLIAKKPCCFGGHKYFIGDEIPVEYVTNPSMQEKLGTIAIVGANSDDEASESVEAPAPTLSLVVSNNGEDMNLEPTAKGIQDVFTVLIGKADDAEPIIKQIEDNDALILLHLADPRKTVKAAAEARAKELSGEQ